MLELKHLKKKYGQHIAVNNVSMRVEKGSIHGLLGPNGAGKSSILRMVTGITLPDEGEILFEEKPYRLQDIISHIGYMPEERGLYKKMKIEEHLIYLAQLKGLSLDATKKQIDFWFAKLDMNTWRKKKVEDLSKGMSQKLQFVATVIHEPKLVILDEPFSGLDPVNSEIIKNEIFELAKKGTSIIFSTHRMEQVEEICDKITLINKGEILLQGQLSNIKDSFKNNTYLLETKEKLEGEVLSYVVSQVQNSYIIKPTQENSIQNILQNCINNHTEIIHFKELLPTLQEIFIQQVEGKSSTTF
ncbi:MAG: ATP-binding cassette domain-containing protein [Chitinophagaceae bacterium]